MPKSSAKDITIISPLFAKPILEHARSVSLPVKQLLEQQGFGDFYQLVYDNHTKTLPGFPVRAIMDYAVNHGQANFGLKAGLNSGKSIIIPAMSHLVKSNPTLYQFLTDFCYYTNQHLSHFNFFNLESEKDGIFIRRNHNFMVPLANDCMEAYTLTLLIELIRDYLQTTWHPSIVWLSAQQATDAFKLHLPRTHIFPAKPVSKIFIDNETLKRKSPRYLGKTSDSPQFISTQSTEKSVLMALQPYALDRLPTLERICRLLGMHPKQVQLKLAAEGTNYRDMLLLLRAKRAEELIKNTDFDMMRIALESGYQNTTHFVRAMKKVWGLTPLQFAKKIRSS